MTQADGRHNHSEQGSTMDLTQIEGLELSEEQQAAIIALHTKETEGLRANRDSLLEEKREAARLADEATAKAREEAERAQLAEARKAGDLEALEKALTAKGEEERQAIEGKYKALQEQVKGAHRDKLVSDLAGDFVSPEVGKMLLERFVNVSENDGAMTATYTDGGGNVITTDQKVFAEWLKSQEAFKTLIKGVNSAGGGAAGSGNGGGAAKTFNEYTPAELVALNRTNPDLYKQLKNQQGN